MLKIQNTVKCNLKNLYYIITKFNTKPQPSSEYGIDKWTDTQNDGTEV